MSKCTIYNCGNKGTLVCSVCKIRHYCCKKCQTLDWPGHKLVCRRDLPDRLKAFANICIAQDRLYVSVSSTFTHFIGRNMYTISAFGCDSITKSYCVVCASPVTYNGPLMYVMFDLCIRGHTVHCYRCNSCNDKGKTICPLSMMDTSRCMYNRFYCLLLCLKKGEIVVIKDIRILLFRAMAAGPGRCCDSWRK